MQKFEQRTIFDFLDQEKQNNRNYKIINDSMLNLDEHIEKESIDAIITDPPYELNFMNKSWDNTGIAFKKETWVKCFNALKPGGYLLAFGGSRTYHRICCAIEDAGFEIRDCIMWLYGSGFPKSMNIGLAIDKKNGVESKVIGKSKGDGSTGKNIVGNETFVYKNQYEDGTYDLKQAQNEWAGWGTCLKPAFEPIIVARKPFKGSLVDNMLEYGVGGLNIDECRIPTEDDLNGGGYRGKDAKKQKDATSYFIKSPKVDGKEYNAPTGRFPANVILTYDETDFDEVCGGFPDTKSRESLPNIEKSSTNSDIFNANRWIHKRGYHYEDEGSAARYFYCAKASKKDRDDGLDEFENTIVNDGRNKPIDNAFQRGETPRKNIHPTVKPTSLMQYLIRLVAPKGATILDVFMGSGSTGKAVMYENKERDANYNFIGFELNEEYCKIAEARIEYAIKNK